MSLRKTLPRRVTADTESTRAKSKSVMNMKKEQLQQQTFPFKLYEMLSMHVNMRSSLPFHGRPMGVSSSFTTRMS